MNSLVELVKLRSQMMRNSAEISASLAGRNIKGVLFFFWPNQFETRHSLTSLANKFILLPFADICVWPFDSNKFVANILLFRDTDSEFTAKARPFTTEVARDLRT